MATKSISLFKAWKFQLTTVFGEFTVDAVPPTVTEGLAIQEESDGLGINELLERVVIPFLCKHVQGYDGVDDLPEYPKKRKDREDFWKGVNSGVCFDAFHAVLENRMPPKSTEPDA